MVKVGGHYISITPANNFMGHGFYQFSPEFFYRSFSPSNGFEIERLLFFESRGADAKWQETPDPAIVGKRVVFVNSVPVCLLVRARKVAEAKVFATMPQQSDYVATWGKRAAKV